MLSTFEDFYEGHLADNLISSKLTLKKLAEEILPGFMARRMLHLGLDSLGPRIVAPGFEEMLPEFPGVPHIALNQLLLLLPRLL